MPVVALPPFPNLPPSEALLLTPADPRYADYLPAANLRTQLAPALRAVCKTENAVAVMADWVRSNSLSFAVRCGGHSYGGMVDEHHACRHPLRHIRAVLLVGSEHRATQTERGIIGYAHRIIFVLGTEEHGHRAEELPIAGRIVFVEVGQNGRLHEGASVGNAGSDLGRRGALGHR